MITDKFLQITGEFKQNQDVISIIRKKYNQDFLFVKRLGIQAQTGHLCQINNEVVEIGKTGMIEYNNVQVKNLLFFQDEPEQTIIDFILE